MNIKLLTVIFFIGLQTMAQKSQITYFDLHKVQLLQSPFKAAMDKDKEYLLSIEMDRLLAPYLKEAGLATKADNYPNWENTGLDGHIGGHYLSALSLMYASTNDPEMLRRANYMVDELERCQSANNNGYVSGIPNAKLMWKQIAEGTIRAHNFGLNDKWVPLYNIHKTYAGLRDAYLYTQNERAKKMLIKLSDWMIQEVSGLSNNQIQEMLKSEYGGLNEIFADVYALTGNKSYLELAKKFSHLQLLNPLLAKQDMLSGLHANMQIPKVIGFQRIAALANNSSWSDASGYFWENVTQKRTVAIGGNSVSEHFNPVNDFSSMIKSVEGPETCNTYNMLKLTKELYISNPKSSYIDFYERGLYNHILSSQNSEKGGFVYFTPMRPGHYRVYSQAQSSFWCCVGSGMENHAKYGEMIYAHRKNELFVNLFIPSRLNWSEKKISVLQQNSFPENAETTLKIDPETPIYFTLNLRCPVWTDSNKLKITVNGKEYKAIRNENGYFSISRKWKKGDQLRLQLPMQLSKEQLPDGSNYYAFLYGPIVLAAPMGSDQQEGLFADDSRGGHIAQKQQLPLNSMPVLVGQPDQLLDKLSPNAENPLTFHSSGLYPEKYAKGLSLLPFYKIQGERYMIYWPVADADKVEQMQQDQAKADAMERHLNSLSLDIVQAGEQQPESDHFIEMNHSNAGYMEDRHYRDAKGWFSYQLNNKNKASKYLYIAYFDANNNRIINIEINGQNIQTQKLEGKSGNTIQYLQLPIPVSESNKEKLSLKFLAEKDLSTAKIIEVRLLNDQYIQ